MEVIVYADSESDEHNRSLSINKSQLSHIFERERYASELKKRPIPALKELKYNPLRHHNSMIESRNRGVNVEIPFSENKVRVDESIVPRVHNPTELAISMLNETDKPPVPPRIYGYHNLLSRKFAAINQRSPSINNFRKSPAPDATSEATTREFSVLEERSQPQRGQPQVVPGNGRFHSPRKVWVNFSLVVRRLEPQDDSIILQDKIRQFNSSSIGYIDSDNGLPHHNKCDTDRSTRENGGMRSAYKELNSEYSSVSPGRRHDPLLEDRTINKTYGQENRPRARHQILRGVTIPMIGVQNDIISSSVTPKDGIKTPIEDNSIKSKFKFMHGGLSPTSTLPSTIISNIKPLKRVSPGLSSSQKVNQPEDDRFRKVLRYMAFGDFINATNRVPPHLDEKRTFRYHAFVGRGNNDAIVMAALRKRWWWVVSSQTSMLTHIEDEDEGIDYSQFNLVWTQIIRHEYVQSIEKGVHCNYKKENTGFSKGQFIEYVKMNYENLYNKIVRFLETKIGAQIIADIGQHSSIDWSMQAFKAYLTRHRSTDPLNTFINIIPEITSVEDITNNSTGSILAPLGSRHLHNHLTNNNQLGDKLNLYKNMSTVHSKECLEYMPTTFVIKNVSDMAVLKFRRIFDAIVADNKNAVELTELQIETEKDVSQQKMEELSGMSAKNNMWILKPGENSNRGRGITVATDWKTIIEFVRDSDVPIIVQKYIENPLLYNGRKFDIRMYALSTWVNGCFKLYFYDMGYVRTSSFDFDLNTTDTFVHLTNEAIQIKHADFGKHEKGNKVTLASLGAYIKNIRPDIDFVQYFLPQMKVITFNFRNSLHFALILHCIN